MVVQRTALAVASWETDLSVFTRAVASGLVPAGFRLMPLGSASGQEAANKQYTETMHAGSLEKAAASEFVSALLLPAASPGHIRQ